MPKPKALAGRIALVTGGAGGIGRATARRLLGEGACVVLRRHRRDGAGAAPRPSSSKKYGNDVVAASWVDVTSEDAVIAGFRDSAVEFGGIDICVSNAGIASAAPIEETTLALWNKNMDILATGYFLVAREAFRLFKRRASAASIVFIGSKNGLAASPSAAAYCTAKAAEIHLARCLALEGAPLGIRVNVVNPDAVLRGSRIWTGEWAQQRAAHYKTSVDESRDHLPRAQPAEAQRLSRGHRRGGVLLRLRAFGQVDRQHHQRRRRQRRRVHALSHSREGHHDLRRSARRELHRVRQQAARGRACHPTTPRSARSSTAAASTSTRSRKAVADFRSPFPPGASAPAARASRRFPGAGEPRNIFDKLEDCAVIHQLTGATPTVSLHIPWDKADDYAALREHGAALGLGFDAMNSNTFQDQPGQTLSYKFGSLTHTDAAARAQAVEHNLECIEIGKTLGSKALTVWIGDGSNFPGPVAFRPRLRALSRRR